MKMARTSELCGRLLGFYQRTAAARLARRDVPMKNPVPLISFSFDDFPHTAASIAAPILARHGLHGTFYVALGLLDGDSPSGRLCSEEDVHKLWKAGHEIGCHTFSHADAWEVAPPDFEDAILRNRAALENLVPRSRFLTMSYPISPPRPQNKLRAARHFMACRGGGQTYNHGSADLNHLKAFFLEKCREDLGPIRNIIDETYSARGWLILATHDVCNEPGPFGVTPRLFAEVVDLALASGARIVPVAQGCRIVQSGSA